LVDAEFAKREGVDREHIRVLGRLLDTVTEQTVGALPELMMVANRLKQLAEEISAEPTAYTHNSEFQHLAARLTEALLRYRLLLPPELFAHYHEFKQAAQDVVFEQNALSRDDRVLDAALATQRKPSIQAACRTIVERFADIDAGTRRLVPGMESVARYLS